MRYEFFSKKSLSSEKIPPTSAALYMHIRRVNYQAYIWKASTVPILDLPPQLDASWTSDDEGHLVPVNEPLHHMSFFTSLNAPTKQNVKLNDAVARTKTLSVQIFVSVTMESVTTELGFV